MHKAQALDNSSKTYPLIPDPIDIGSHHPRSLEHLLYIKRKHEEGDSDHVLASRYACGFPLPDFQRGLVWSTEQEVRFIESVWLGLPLGTYTVHECDWNSDGSAKPMSGWLIDGQQRLTSIERYLNDELVVYGGVYSDLSKLQKFRFRMTQFSMTSVELFDLDKIKSLYDLMAFGGVAHKESERAVHLAAT